MKTFSNLYSYVITGLNYSVNFLDQTIARTSFTSPFLNSGHHPSFFLSLGLYTWHAAAFVAPTDRSRARPDGFWQTRDIFK
jgi:hypothetical protein